MCKQSLCICVLTLLVCFRGQGRLLEVVLHRARKAASGEYDAVKVSEVRADGLDVLV
jgi:hypothetical protein